MTLQLEPQTYGKSIPNLRHTVSVCYLYHWHTFSALGSPLHHLTRCHGEMGCLALRRLCVHSLTRSTKVALFLLYKATSSGMSDCYFAGGVCPVPGLHLKEGMEQASHRADTRALLNLITEFDYHRAVFW